MLPQVRSVLVQPSQIQSALARPQWEKLTKMHLVLPHFRILMQMIHCPDWLLEP